MKTTNMQTIIRKELRDMEIQNGETLDHKTQIILRRACAGDSIKKTESFHRALNSITKGNHLVQGAPLTLNQ